MLSYDISPGSLFLTICYYFNINNSIKFGRNLILRRTKVARARVTGYTRTLTVSLRLERSELGWCGMVSQRSKQLPYDWTPVQRCVGLNSVTPS